MPYTVWSRGRLIGETDLAFRPLIDVQRSGHFHPNAEGERVMELIASPLPAMRAYLHRDARDADGNGFVLPELQGSALFADLAESFHHFRSLELELRREDGSVVPTEDIGFQDTHPSLAVTEAELEEYEHSVDDPGGPDDDDLPEATEAERELEMDVLHDLEALDSPSDWDDDVHAPWVPPELEAPQFPRYQIHVMLRHGNSIP